MKKRLQEFSEAFTSDELHRSLGFELEELKNDCDYTVSKLLILNPNHKERIIRSRSTTIGRAATTVGRAVTWFGTSGETTGREASVSKVSPSEAKLISPGGDDTNKSKVNILR